MKRTRMILLAVALALACAPPVFARTLQFKQVAVLVFAKGPQQEIAARAAASRIETVLADNGVTVLDQAKAAELKDVWKKLEDPGYFVTADDFVKNADKYKVDGIVRAFVTAEVAAGLADTFSASAQADVRFVSEDAKVDAFTTAPMGVPGMPPSDGLTASAAMINAVQRSVDHTLQQMGLTIADFTAPRSLAFELRDAAGVDLGAFDRVPPSETADFIGYATLESQTWRKETVTCTAAATAGGVGAVGGYVADTDFQRHPPRIYGSTLHVIDLNGHREIAHFETEPVEKRPHGENGPARLHDCLFVGNWRFLAAVTGNFISLWDTERGVKMAEMPLPDGFDKADLSWVRRANRDFLVVEGSSPTRVFEIARKGAGP